jgi:cell division septum initiation protein DivIVA
MTDYTRPTLTEIARQTYWESGFELASDVIDRALVEAGICPKDGKERIRFCNLVKDAYYQCQEDEIAQLGEHIDRAREELGDGASIDDVISRAYQNKNEVEGGDDPR